MRKSHNRYGTHTPSAVDYNENTSGLSAHRPLSILGALITDVTFRFGNDARLISSQLKLRSITPNYSSNPLLSPRIILILTYNINIENFVCTMQSILLWIANCLWSMDASRSEWIMPAACDTNNLRIGRRADAHIARMEHILFINNARVASGGRGMTDRALFTNVEHVFPFDIYTAPRPCMRNILF